MHLEKAKASKVAIGQQKHVRLVLPFATLEIQITMQVFCRVQEHTHRQHLKS